MALENGETISISSKAENIIKVEEMIDNICAKFNINEDFYGNILVALTEAVNNAIYHGNKSNPQKHIEISFKASPDLVSFVIKDEGTGFGFANLPDPTDPENIEKPNGRGVFLMRNLADKVCFEENGSKVTLDFKLKAS